MTEDENQAWERGFRAGLAAAGLLGLIMAVIVVALIQTLR